MPESNGTRLTNWSVRDDHILGVDFRIRGAGRLGLDHQAGEGVIRSRWFDRHRQDARDTLRQGDACMVGAIFLLLTCVLVAGIIVLVQIGAL
jgi:hypothetical protein